MHYYIYLLVFVYLNSKKQACFAHLSLSIWNILRLFSVAMENFRLKCRNSELFRQTSGFLNKHCGYSKTSANICNLLCRQSKHQVREIWNYYKRIKFFISYFLWNLLYTGFMQVTCQRDSKIMQQIIIVSYL